MLIQEAALLHDKHSCAIRYLLIPCLVVTMYKESRERCDAIDIYYAFLIGKGSKHGICRIILHFTEDTEVGIGDRYTEARFALAVL